MTCGSCLGKFWFEYVADLSNAGLDRGKGGKFLFLPPGWAGEVPGGYFSYRSATYGNLLLWQGFLLDGSATGQDPRSLEPIVSPAFTVDRPPPSRFSR